MIIQKIQVYNYNPNYSFQMQGISKGRVSFGAELGDEFVSQTNKGEIEDKNGVSNFIEENAAGKIGYLKKSKAADILEGAAKLVKESIQRQAQQTKKEQELNRRKKDQMAIKNFNHKMAVIEFHKENKISREELKTFGRQMLEVSQILLSNNGKLINSSKQTPKELANAMRNNMGYITPEMFDFVKRIIKMKSFTDASLLPIVIHTVKNADGDLDLEKAGALIGAYNRNGAMLMSVAEIINNFYNTNPEEYGVDSKEINRMLAQYKKDSAIRLANALNEKYGFHPDGKVRLKATVNKNGLLEIATYSKFIKNGKNDYDSWGSEVPTDPVEFGLDNDFYFQFIEKFSNRAGLDLSNVKHLTSVGGLRFVEKLYGADKVPDTYKVHVNRFEEIYPGPRPKEQ